MREAESNAAPLILQVCTNDHPPFADICATYERAGESLGARVETVFLSEPFSSQTLPGAHYLGKGEAGQRHMVRRFKGKVAQLGQTPLLSICHRYRAGRTLVASGMSSHRSVTVAHEFGLFRRRRRRLSRRAFARSMLVAGVSPAVQEELSRTVPGALLLPNVIDLGAFDAGLRSREDACAELGLTVEPDTLTIAVVGRLIPWKRPELALAALRELGAQSGVRLVFLGDGPLLESLRKEAGDLPVQMAGFHQDARSLLSAFDALLQVSEDREAFGMVALEAMAAGIPVLAQRAPGPTFLLGEDVYYAEPDAPAIAAAIRQLQRDVHNGTTAELTAAARARVERHFSITALAARLDDLFFTGPML